MRKAAILGAALLVLALLSGLGLFTALGVPAWLTSRPSEEADLRGARPLGSPALPAAGGPTLQGATSQTPGARPANDGTQAAGRLRGRVVDTSGRGIAGARVIAIPDTTSRTFTLDMLGRKGCPATHTTTDAEGRFGLPRARDTPYHIVLADAPGMGFAGRGQVVPGTELTLVLAQAARFEGHVRDEQGQAIAGVELRLVLLIDCLQLEVKETSRADGSFELPGLPVLGDPPTGVYHAFHLAGWIEAQARGFAPYFRQLPEIGTPVRVLREDIVLLRGTTLVGRVEDADSQEPIRGAHVHVLSNAGMGGFSRGPGLAGYESPFSERVLGQTASDAAGAFEVPGLLGGRGELHVVLVADGYAVTSLPLRLELSERTDVTFRLFPAVGVSGRVVEADGTPVLGANVTAHPNSASPGGWVPSVVGDVPRAWGTTGADGRFVLPAVKGSRAAPVEIQVTATEHARRGVDGNVRQATAAVRASGPGPTDAGDIVLPAAVAPYATTTVRVLLPDGSPCEGAYLGQASWDTGMRSDAEGIVTVPWPHATPERPRRPIHLFALFVGHAPTPFTIPVAAVGGRVEVRLEPGHELAGRVEALDGTPVPDTEIWVADGRVAEAAVFPARHEEAHQVAGRVTRDGGRSPLFALVYANDAGAFALPNLPAGPYQVRAFRHRRVSPPEGTPPLFVTARDVASGTRDLVLRLPPDDSPPLGDLRVRVVDDADGTPVRDATVYVHSGGHVLRALDNGAPGRPPEALADAGTRRRERILEPGVHQIIDIPEGPVDVQVIAPGRRSGRIAGVIVVPDAETIVPDVRLVRGACVTGRVRAPEGQALTDRQLEFVPEGEIAGLPSLQAALRPDGTFSVCGFAVGTYSVVVRVRAFDPTAVVWIPAGRGPLTVASEHDELVLDATWVVAGTLSLKPEDARLPPPPWDRAPVPEERRRFGDATRVTVQSSDGSLVASFQPVVQQWLGALALAPGRYVARIEFPAGETREQQVDVLAGKSVDVTFAKKP